VDDQSKAAVTSCTKHHKWTSQMGIYDL